MQALESFRLQLRRVVEFCSAIFQDTIFQLYPTFILVLVKSQHAEHVQNDLNNLLKKERSLVADLKDALAKEKRRQADMMDALEKEKVHAMSLK